MALTPEEANTIRQDCNKKISLSDTLHRLEANPDFQVLIKKYCEEEPARLVGLLGDPAFYAHEKAVFFKEDLQNRMIGIAKFSEYCRDIHNIANMARKTLDDLSRAEQENKE